MDGWMYEGMGRLVVTGPKREKYTFQNLGKRDVFLEPGEKKKNDVFYMCSRGICTHLAMALPSTIWAVLEAMVESALVEGAELENARKEEEASEAVRVGMCVPAEERTDDCSRLVEIAVCLVERCKDDSDRARMGEREVMRMHE